jgi:hypothetical protein
MLGADNTITTPGSHNVEDCVDNLNAAWSVDPGFLQNRERIEYVVLSQPVAPGS